MHKHKVTVQCTYSVTMEKMTRFLSSQYKRGISTPTIIIAEKRGIRTERRVAKPNRKIRIITTQVL